MLDSSDVLQANSNAVGARAPIGRMQYLKTLRLLAVAFASCEMREYPKD